MIQFENEVGESIGQFVIAVALLPMGTSKNGTGFNRIPFPLEIQRHSIGVCLVLDKGSPKNIAMPIPAIHEIDVPVQLNQCLLNQSWTFQPDADLQPTRKSSAHPQSTRVDSEFVVHRRCLTVAVIPRQLATAGAAPSSFPWLSLY